ncbi:THAP domain-containing protein 4 [Ditylenchus destructor]|uniref:THAP domain-containing protein 4 n=1 Tax=Ditylenchus destructor TaxID=166010 RepID=A0AAD4N309_9BILA|nr:THAP domain-containing protein 4 [Ditylenchus destructor]
MSHIGTHPGKMISLPMLHLAIKLTYCLSFIGATTAQFQPTCSDLNANCRHWVLSDQSQCTSAGFVRQACLKSCGVCAHLPKKFDIKLLPVSLAPVEWLIGIWRSEAGGKAFFPTIPKFTYGEQIEFSIASPGISSSQPSLNYSTFAWSMDKEKDELHSEYGFVTLKQGSSGSVALTTVMSNGFVTVEEGVLSGHKIRFRLVDIGRISFSRDLPVHDLIREWTLLDSNTLEARLSMHTLTHTMREHTTIVYSKIFP